MVSLNEKRSKTRYVVQNKTEWADDGNKFGKRMLEKMGWQTGSGLGKNQHGITEHIDLKFKANLKGVGFVNGKYDHTWIGHSQSFDSVLQQLQQSHPTTSSNSLNNITQTIEQTNTRFNYKKQSAGKDLSSKSHDELNCIFGWNKANEINNQSLQQQDEEQQHQQNNDQSEQNLYVTSQQSIEDYFKDKFRKKTKKLTESLSTDDQQETTTTSQKRKHASEQQQSLDNPFPNSNLNQLEGYEGWEINPSLQDIFKKKRKTKKRKSTSN